jgi:Fe-Mn family superoxide dismutase
LGRDDNPLFLAPNTVTPASESPKSPTSEDASAGSAPLNQATRGETAKQTRSKQRLGGPESATDSTSKITPLAVLNLYELAWLGEKYGVWDKRNYAKDWFRKLDWSRLIKRGQ